MPRFSLLVIAFTCSQLVGVAHAGCEKDTDCKGERICEASACVDPSPTTDDAPEEKPPNSEDAAAQTAQVNDDAEGSGTENRQGTHTPAQQSEETPTQATAEPTNPEDWWKKEAREAEAPVLQAIFDEMPRPIRKKGNAKLVYQRAVPVVISDIHETTHRWGGKGQIGVHFLGISKVHTTTTLDPINAETAGIPYCPVNCARIIGVKMVGDQLNFLYDGPIKEWAGNVGDNAAGYIRQVGKQYKAACSVPMLYNHAPKNSWLDPEQVQAVKDGAVAEIKRYCGMD